MTDESLGGNMPKPKRFMSMPPGCCIMHIPIDDGDYLLTRNYDGFSVFEVDSRYLGETWAVLRPSADNPYSKLPWDIPIPEGYEPDGEWEPKAGEKAAYRCVSKDDTFLDKSNPTTIVKGDEAWCLERPRLCVRKVKTKRTVIEVEFLETHAPTIQVGDDLRLLRCAWTMAYDATVTAVREVER